ncbi:MAG: asparagine synthetase B [bacterium]|nr:asparagine synthetase B [bacterium]
MRTSLAIILVLILVRVSPAQKLLVPMDNTQRDHLRAYGLMFWALEQGLKGEWLLNYRGGSFLLDHADNIKEHADLLGVSCVVIDDAALVLLYQTMDQENMNRIYLDKAPKIGVYAPTYTEPWDDAVRLVLDYSQIPYTRVWDKEVLLGELSKFDWLHLHHEDFTGQYGKFYGSFRNAEWYKMDVARAVKMARELGFKSVQQEKCAVAKMIQAYVMQGGFLFGMCSVMDSLDISLASEGIDIIPPEIDGTSVTANAQEKLDYNRTFAFTGFKLVFDPYVYEVSDIDIDIMKEGLYNTPDTFTLFDFSAKIDPVPCMLVQNHENAVKGFLGQTTAFVRKVIKENVTILADTPNTDRVKYIHGDFGKGTFTFLGGHDPEDYRHLVGDPATDLSLHKNSPGYRLILNNVLYPAAKKKNRKT